MSPYLKNKLFKFKKIFFVHLFTCAYIVWVISPPCPSPPPPPLPSSVSGRSCSALVTDLKTNFSKRVWA
jgi:hypothetical protein